MQRTPRKSKYGMNINILSPNVVHMKHSPNSNKISISTYHPPHAAFLSPTQQTTNGFSPSKSSNNASRNSISTASPSKYTRYSTQKIYHDSAETHNINYRPVQNDTQHKKQSTEIVIAGRFKLISKLGKGSFGVAYSALDLTNNAKIAIKLERKRNNKSSTMNAREIKILQSLKECARVPQLIWHGNYKSYFVFALELHGMNLSDLLQMCNGQFSIKTAIYVLVECIKCMQQIHSQGIVHRDIKPQNFIINRDPNNHNIHVIDFGLSSWFMKDGEHIEFMEGCSPVGTARYASLNNHRGIHQTRRDDMESIGFMIIFFMKKVLPWQGVKVAGRVKKWQAIKDKKASVSAALLSSELPMEFTFYLDYVRKLRFDETPNYAKLIRVFKKLYVKQGFYAQDMKRLGICDEDIECCDDYSFDIADIIAPDWKL